jgi:hypothetical protein
MAGRRSTGTNAVFVSPRETRRRLNICGQCPHFVRGWRCSKCSCFLKRKATLANASCPVHKW